MNAQEIVSKAKSIRDVLKRTSDFKENAIDDSLAPVLPYCGGKDVKLIILGQDPTIKNESTRALKI